LDLLRDIRERSRGSALCHFILRQVEKDTRPATSPQVIASGTCNESDVCTIRFHYDGQGGGHLTRGLMQRGDNLEYRRQNCTVSVEQAQEINLYPIFQDQALKWLGSRSYEPLIDFKLARHWVQHTRCARQSWYSCSKHIYVAFYRRTSYVSC
jgi:hypothetical protein